MSKSRGMVSEGRRHVGGCVVQAWAVLCDAMWGRPFRRSNVDAARQEVPSSQRVGARSPP